MLLMHKILYMIRKTCYLLLVFLYFYFTNFVIYEYNNFKKSMFSLQYIVKNYR